MEIEIATNEKEIEYPEVFSKQLKTFLQALLNKDPSKRPKIEDLTKFEWFQYTKV